MKRDDIVFTPVVLFTSKTFSHAALLKEEKTRPNELNLKKKIL